MATKCFYYWLVVETEDFRPTEVAAVSDDVFSSSFLVLRLRAGLPFCFEQTSQNGMPLLCLMWTV